MNDSVNIPVKLLQNKNLDAVEKMIIINLIIQDNELLTHVVVSKLVGVCYRTIQRKMKVLIEKGYISMERLFNNKGMYKCYRCKVLKV